MFVLHPGRLTWNIIIGVWKIMFLSKWVIRMFHVNLPGCICMAAVFVFEKNPGNYQWWHWFETKTYFLLYFYLCSILQYHYNFDNPPGSKYVQRKGFTLRSYSGEGIQTINPTLERGLDSYGIIVETILLLSLWLYVWRCLLQDYLFPKPASAGWDQWKITKKHNKIGPADLSMYNTGTAKKNW